jgi:hypothetical protein
LALSENDKLVVEKTPQHVRRLSFILHHFTRAKVINVYRDGRDCYCSAVRSGNIPQAAKILTFARYWNDCIRKRLKVCASPQVLDVYYERLVTEPEKTIKNVMGFCGNTLEARQLDPAVFGADPRAATKPFEKLSQPIDSMSVGRWREILSSTDKAMFWRVSGHWLKAIGYEAD